VEEEGNWGGGFGVREQVLAETAIDAASLALCELFIASHRNNKICVFG
jgi:hypothetical protein